MSTSNPRHAVITGGGTGIGLAIARELASKGARITLMARDTERLERVAAQLAGAHVIALDVTREASVTAAFAEAASIAPVSILVNNAGGAFTASLPRTSLDQWNAMLALNLTGVCLCCRAVIDTMIAQGDGRIVNVASTAGLKGYAYTAAYTAAKHGVVGLTRALAAELGSKPVTVNCVCPGFTNTELVERSLSNISSRTGRSREEALAELVRFNPQKRLVEPHEVAAAVAWLVSDGAAAVTGQAISVSGGEVT
ncbi:MAG: SDR family oxidoreductase [Gammaproteobacteria bacterium]|nr:SDR family oxidoreductase [Gammaproteobacteria bacterium]